ncbi:MAG: hypothetical protein U5S82_23105 [Gammaproteobacteria bacterium]|nr:hypothetical protein [Gammaproteobacteria bacterium]MDZ7752080.1 hypothetical protein [Gammaproteobacteria bacterium]MDZ7752562.1 hypothetical protein [Gammaproteobacteria bacterium]MDZ7752935.1 hypothetical protein [Gammaproteobacteria bacterium]MDZ7753311.1 hypothetical protein [Gammaproteobacteria bacterium]
MTHPPIPDDWTPEQALAIYDFIDELRDAIWSRYDRQLVELMQQDRITTFEVDDDDLIF